MPFSIDIPNRNEYAQNNWRFRVIFQRVFVATMQTIVSILFFLSLQ